MKLNEYQNKARSFAVYPDLDNNIVYPTLGLAGEAGEVANQVKKVLRDDGGFISDERYEKLVDELGDVLWYVANVAEELNINLSDIAVINLMKLSSRKVEDAIHGDKRNG